MSDDWKQTACILCECNCGVEVQLGGDNGRHIVRTRGDEAHPASRGYLCQKASRLDHYQNGPDRITQPLRRRDDGSFEAIDWDTAIREVAARFAALRERHSGASIFYYGGGGQGNHLPGAYASATRRALGSRYRSNALAQEKTGEFWVNGRLFGNGVRADFEHCEVAVFLGKNPWQSHGIPRARITLREIARDPARTLIVIDPVRTETAELADIHLQPRPGTDAWLLHAMLGVLWQEGLTDAGWIAARTTGIESLAERLAAIPVATACAACGIAEEQVRLATRRIAAAGSVACFEDLGVQMNRHSTLVSYLEKLLWLLTGNFAKRGAQYIPAAIQSLFGSGASSQRSPVAGAPIISGLVPCNVIAEEILSDHPDRYRGMLIESANPAHSLAESARFREALRALDTVVVIDVAMTETARLAHYVLPAATQYEKWEATFFNFEFPRNYFHLRRPLFDAPADALPEAEIHARLVEALDAPCRGTWWRICVPRRRADATATATPSSRRCSVSPRWPASRPFCCIARWARPCPTARRPRRCCGPRCRCSRCAKPPHSRAPALPGAMPASTCSMRSSRVIPASCSPRTISMPAGRGWQRTTGASTWRCRSCSRTGTRWQARRQRPTRVFRSCSAPASAATTPPTRSIATRTGAARDARERFASTRTMRDHSAPRTGAC